jgi:cell division protein FtsL
MARTVAGSKGRIFWMEKGIKIRPTVSKSKVFLIALLMVFFIGGSLFYVWSRIRVVQLGYEISYAMKEGRRLAEENKRLRVEIATLKSYARIEKIAMEELGMIKPKPEEVIVIR